MQQAFPLLYPEVRGDLVCVGPSNKALSLLSWNLTKPWASGEEKKKLPPIRNKPAVMGNGEAQS